MTTLLLARHGETDWNNQRRWQGHADQPLNERGREQARALAEELRGRRIDAIWSSDLLRARETAEIVAAALGLPVELDPELREVDVGSWSGVVHTDLEAHDPEGFRRWQDGGRGWSGGESYEEMGARVVGAVNRIAAQHPGQTVLVVSHGGSIRACVAAAGGSTSAGAHGTMGNCGVAELRIADGRLAAAD